LLHGVDGIVFRPTSKLKHSASYFGHVLYWVS